MKINNNNIETIIVTTKTGNVLFFERKTGRPIYNINYKNTPDSNIPGEYVSEKQLFITKPERFSKIEFKISDLKKKYLKDKEFIKDFENNSVYGWFHPPTLGKNTILYGNFRFN